MFIVTKFIVPDLKPVICGVVDKEGFLKGYEILLKCIKDFNDEYSVKHISDNRVEVYKKGYLYGSTLFYIFEIHPFGEI
jgi:hypothetical protein